MAFMRTVPRKEACLAARIHRPLHRMLRFFVASKFSGDMNELEKTYIPHLCTQFERGCTLQSRVTSELVQRIGQCTSPMTVPWSSRSIDRIARQPGSSVPVEIAS